MFIIVTLYSLVVITNKSIISLYSFPFLIGKTSDPHPYSSNTRSAFVCNIGIYIHIHFENMKTDVERVEQKERHHMSAPKLKWTSFTPCRKFLYNLLY